MLAAGRSFLSLTHAFQVSNPFLPQFQNSKQNRNSIILYALHISDSLSHSDSFSLSLSTSWCIAFSDLSLISLYLRPSDQADLNLIDAIATESPILRSEIDGELDLTRQQNPESLYRSRWPRRSQCIAYSLGLSSRHRRRRWPGQLSLSLSLIHRAMLLCYAIYFSFSFSFSFHSICSTIYTIWVIIRVFFFYLDLSKNLA